MLRPCFSRARALASTSKADSVPIRDIFCASFIRSQKYIAGLMMQVGCGRRCSCGKRQRWSPVSCWLSLACPARSCALRSVGGRTPRYLAAPGQVVAVRAGRLFDANAGTDGDQSDRLDSRRPDRGGRAGGPGSTGRARHRSRRRDAASGHDRRARPHQRADAGRVGRAPDVRHGSERPARSGRGLHHRRGHGFARRVRHRRAAQRDQHRPGSRSPHAGRRAVAESARREADGEHRAGVLQRVHGREERQRTLAGARGRARAEAARNGLGQDLHDAGLRRRRPERIQARRIAGRHSVADARRSPGDRGRGSSYGAEGRLPHLRRRRHAFVRSGRRGPADAHARAVQR